MTFTSPPTILRLFFPPSRLPQDHWLHLQCPFPTTHLHLPLKPVWRAISCRIFPIINYFQSVKLYPLNIYMLWAKVTSIKKKDLKKNNPAYNLSFPRSLATVLILLSCVHILIPLLTFFINLCCTGQQYNGKTIKSVRYLGFGSSSEVPQPN